MQKKVILLFRLKDLSGTLSLKQFLRPKKKKVIKKKDIF